MLKRKNYHSAATVDSIPLDGWNRMGTIYKEAIRLGYNPTYAAMLALWSYAECKALPGSYEKGKNKTGAGAFSATGPFRQLFVDTYNKLYNANLTQELLTTIPLDKQTATYINFIKNNYPKYHKIATSRPTGSFWDAANAMWAGSVMTGPGWNTPEKFNSPESGYRAVLNKRHPGQYNTLFNDIDNSGLDDWLYMLQRHLNEDVNKELIRRFGQPIPRMQAPPIINPSSSTRVAKPIVGRKSGGRLIRKNLHPAKGALLILDALGNPYTLNLDSDKGKAYTLISPEQSRFLNTESQKLALFLNTHGFTTIRGGEYVPSMKYDEGTLSWKPWATYKPSLPASTTDIMSLHLNDLWSKNRIVSEIPAREWGPPGNENGTENVGQALLYYFLENSHKGDAYVKSALETAKLEKDSETKEDAVAYLNHAGAMRQYFGLPNLGVLETSPYTPTKTKNKNIKYYRFKSHREPSYQEEFIQHGLLMPQGEKMVLVDPTFNNYTLSRDRDENGAEYISTYDKWDYNPAVRGGSRNMDWIIPTLVGGKPFELYDRYYPADVYGIPRDNSTFLEPVYVTPEGPGQG